MDDQLAAFLQFMQKERSCSENTVAAYRNDLGQFMEFLRGENAGILEWQQVTPTIVLSFFQFLQEKKYAPSTIARKVAAIKSFFHHLFAYKQIQADPTIQINSPKVEKRLPTPLTSEDVEQLLKAPTVEHSPKHLRDSALLALLYATGMRVTEVVSLKLEDISLDDKKLRSPGEDNKVRFLSFDEQTANNLRLYLQEGRPQLAKQVGAQAVFLNHRGQQLTRQGLWLIIKAYAKETHLEEGVTPHTLRHSFAAHKLQSGLNIRQLQQMLGHANISTTQIYTQIDKTTIVE